MKTFKRVMIILLVTILLVGGVGGSIAVFGTYSSGSRVGQIVKFSKKGVVFKTYEGDLNVGGFAKDSDGDISPNVWAFSVYRNDDAIVRAIDDAMDKGHPVKLHYKEKFFQFQWRGDTKYFIYQVEKVEDENVPAPPAVQPAPAATPQAVERVPAAPANPAAETPATPVETPTPTQ